MSEKNQPGPEKKELFSQSPRKKHMRQTHRVVH